MTTVVNDLTTPRPTPRVTFDWDVKGSAFIWTAGLNTYAPSGVNYTPVGFPITFTAATSFPSGDSRSFVAWEWDFGDGTTGYFSTTTHTYKVANRQAQTVLVAIDSEGVRWHTRRQMYLTKLGLTVLTPGATVLAT